MHALEIKRFTEHLKTLSTATGLRLMDVFSENPQCDLEDCTSCNRNPLVCDQGNNVYTLNFLLQTLASECRLGEDFCLGISQDESEEMLPFRVCLTKTALKHMLEVHRLGEIVNRANSGVLASLRKAAGRPPIKHSTLLRRARREANRMVGDIRHGLSVIAPEQPEAGSRMVSPQLIASTKIFFFHGGELRQATKGKIDWHIWPRPDVLCFAHYHRLWVFEYRRMVCVITGCWMLTFPAYEVVLFPSIGGVLFSVDTSANTFQIKVYRYGTEEPIPGLEGQE